ncbi:hypothetical protein AAD018_001400 [Aestuariibius insulae]|uniref:hypothetical protein n=1 Tax=Aestuariibius insulae TaxID=2058287 RepID=UPI00345E3EF5
MTTGKIGQIKRLQALAQARLKRAEAQLSVAHQLYQQRQDTAKQAEADFDSLTERADSYVSERFLDMGETTDPANAFTGIIAGASEARKVAASAELTAVRSQTRVKEAQGERTSAARICQALSNRRDRLERLSVEEKRILERRLNLAAEDEVAEMAGWRMS